ncbi:TIGR00270 family protein [Candidatus Pacearchaeota archaeon CG_4_10_14_0_2_um_filter_31_10]|nr:MAG: TIGR00270 family protein [Candidatus Pacearchaeota archaeon CG10_big_fil_rev_8_21_14_0_10_31_59]PIZ80037.1 MAG: TIGR00270 family protein [Candidatus Pacearchaeota archaeon CG_4_10_14_0_2_um_filter_31_10]
MILEKENQINIPLECEECGKKTSVLFSSIIEGKLKKLCQTCIGHDTIVLDKNDYEIANIKDLPRDKIVSKNTLVHNFHDIIRGTRERRGLSRKDIAKAINEPESVISQIEMGLVPGKKVIEKLEKFLRIKIINPLNMDELNYPYYRHGYLRKPRTRDERIVQREKRNEIESHNQQQINFKSKTMTVSDLKRFGGKE